MIYIIFGLIIVIGILLFRIMKQENDIKDITQYVDGLIKGEYSSLFDQQLTPQDSTTVLPIAQACAVSQTPGAIGYVGLGYISKEAKAISVDGVIASETSVREGTYKLACPLYMYTNGKPKGLKHI